MQNLKEKIKKDKGISLVALVVTIIILLILAGVAISQLSENGVLKKSQKSRDEYKNQENLEIERIGEYSNALDGKFVENISRDGYGAMDLKVSSLIYHTKDNEAFIDIKVNEEYEDAVYIYIMNNKILNHTTEKEMQIIDSIEADKTYNIIILGVEQNGNVHKYVKALNVTKQSIDVYARVADIANLAEFGLSYTYAGSAQRKYTELYNLGQGSGSGIHTNTYTLTMDYEKIKTKITEQDITGIYANFRQAASASSGYTSWCDGEIVVNYSDSTSESIKTERSTAKNTSKDEEKSTFIMFDKTKTISNIKFIIHEYDSDYGGADGMIKNINFLRN